MEKDNVFDKWLYTHMQKNEIGPLSNTKYNIQLKTDY